MSRPKAITFDVGGTLIEPCPSVGHIYAHVAAEHGFHASPERLDQRFRSAWKARHDFQHRRADWALLVEKTFHDDLPAGASAAFFDALYRRFAEPDVWRVFDDVRPTLRALRDRGVKLGIISNWDERLRPLLEKLRLRESFEAIIISHEAAHMKPAKEIFLAAARQLAFPPSAIMHVGDSTSEDVAGAKAAGMKAFWLDRNQNSLADLL